jgi:hypothetical protein
VLASTPPAVALSPCFAAGRNGARDTFLDPASRERFGDDWDRVARSVVAGLRALSATDADDPQLTGLIGELSVKSEEFRRRWALHHVRPRAGSGTSRMTHPQVGPLELTLRMLRAARDAGVRRVVLTSSFAAIGYGHPATERAYTGADWTDPVAEIGAYVKSKTLAERAAWTSSRARAAQWS